MGEYVRLHVSWIIAVVTLVLAIQAAFPLEHVMAMPQDETHRSFRAGAATSDVTPVLGTSISGNMQDQQARYIHDELYARALALDDGQTQIAIVVVDNCMIPRKIYDEAKRRAHSRTGVPANHMLMSATHTHSAGTAAHVFQSTPDAEYAEFLTEQIANAVVQAVNNLEPAQIGWGSGHVPDQVFNRRWFVKSEENRRNPFGGVDSVRTNPPRDLSELIEPAGPTDPELSIVSVQSSEGRPIALLANYSLHYVGGVGSGHISADYFGAFAEQIKEKIGDENTSPPFVGIMSNGTSGDINNVDFTEPSEPQQPYAQIHKVASEVAEEAFRVYQSIEYQDWVPLQVQLTELELGVRRPDVDEVQRAREIIEQGEGAAMQGRDEIYARETMFLSLYPETVSLPLQAVQIGELGISAIPCEVFVEIGLELKDKSPFENTFTMSLANGYNGYLPTVEHHKLGGYETWRAKSSYLEIEAAPKIVDQLLALLNRLREDS